MMPDVERRADRHEREQRQRARNRHAVDHLAEVPAHERPRIVAIEPKHQRERDPDGDARTGGEQPGAAGGHDERHAHRRDARQPEQTHAADGLTRGEAQRDRNQQREIRGERVRIGVRRIDADDAWIILHPHRAQPDVRAPLIEAEHRRRDAGQRRGRQQRYFRFSRQRRRTTRYASSPSISAVAATIMFESSMFGPSNT